jgi:hypothetical protein
VYVTCSNYEISYLHLGNISKLHRLKNLMIILNKWTTGRRLSCHVWIPVEISHVRERERVREREMGGRGREQVSASWIAHGGMLYRRWLFCFQTLGFVCSAVYGFWSVQELAELAGGPAGCDKVARVGCLCYLYRTFSWLHKIVFRQMYTLYYLLFNTVYIKNSPTCFQLCYSLSSGTHLFITPAIDVWCSLKYIS